MFARGRDGIAGVDGGQGPNPGPCRDDVVSPESRIGKEAVRRREQVCYVGFARSRLVGCDTREGIGGADDGIRPARQDEHHSAVIRREQRQCAVVADPLVGHDDVSALAPSHVRSRCRTLESAKGVTPGTSRIDDDTRREVHSRARQFVAHFDAGDLAILRDDAVHASMVDHRRAPVPRVDRDGEREPRVVGAGVIIDRAADQAVATQCRLLAKDGLRAESAMAADVPEEREQVIEREARGQLPHRHPRPPVDGPSELERLHEMWRKPKEAAALGARLEH